MNKVNALESFFVTVPRGLEDLLVAELQALDIPKVWPTPGGVAFQSDWAGCYRANLESRLATRILWRVAQGGYENEDDLYQLVLRQPWETYFPVNKTFRVVTTASRCPLKSLDFVTLRIKDAVCDRFRQKHDSRPNIDTHAPDVRVHVYLTENAATLYLDTSGDPLWQRGLRHANVEAPVKENLAAALLRLAGWKPGTPLLDPMCGSGTFLLEAACMSLDQAPGLHRVRFGFESLLTFQEPVWQSLRSAALARQKPAQPLPLFASDLDPRAVRATQRNLQDAGLGNVARVQEADITTLSPPKLPEDGPPPILIANPPYGERIGELDELTQLYPLIGTTLKQRFPGWTAYFFTADLRLPKLVGLRPSRKTPLFNGPLECRLFEIKLVAGSNRPIKPQHVVRD